MKIPVAKAPLLEGKRGLIVGIANEQSIAWGCAKGPAAAERSAKESGDRLHSRRRRVRKLRKA